ncbi:MAG TPA: metallophosphoesterase family protein [Longimicrobiales bacterium]
MLVGLISDTHGQLRPEVFDRFAAVDRILHAGDIGSVELLLELEAIAPVTAVWGNTDGFDVRARVAETAEAVLDGCRVVVVHGHQLGSPRPDSLREAYPEADVIVYGHTHRADVDRADGRWVVNPGAAGPARFRLRPSVALMTVERASVDVRIVEL